MSNSLTPEAERRYLLLLTESRRDATRGVAFQCWCKYDGPQWDGASRCAHCGGLLAGGDVTANGLDETAAAHVSPSDVVSRAADALSDLSALVENGSARLTAYPSELPSLDELAAAVYAIETARTFSHDQLVAFSRIAGDAADGHFVDGNGACASMSLAAAPNGLAVVTVDGRQVATIDSAGDVTYFSATGEAI